MICGLIHFYIINPVLTIVAAQNAQNWLQYIAVVKMKVLNGVALIRWLYVDFSQLNEYFIAPTSSYKCEQLRSF